MTFIRTTAPASRLAGVALLAAALIVGAAPARAGADDGAADNGEIVRRAFDDWRAGGNVFAGLLAPDVTWTIHGSGPVAGTYASLDAFIAQASLPLVSRLATPIVPEVHDIWDLGETVIIRFDGAATTTSGAPYANQFLWIFRMTDGRVREAEAFLDLVAYGEVVENNAPRAD